MKEKLFKNMVILFSAFIFITSATAASIENLKEVKKQTESENFFGFILPTNTSQSYYIQINTTKLINELLRKNIEVYWITGSIDLLYQDFFENEENRVETFEKGSYIISFSDDPYNKVIATSIIYKYFLFSDIEIYKLKQELSDTEAYKLNEPRIALHNGPWMGNTWYYTHLNMGGFDNYTLLTWKEIPDKLNKNDFNLLIYGFMPLSSAPILVRDHVLNMRGTNAIRKYVGSGGSFLGSCLAAYELSGLSSLLSNKLKINFPKLPSITTLSLINARFQPLLIEGEINVEIIDPDCPVSYGLPNIVPSIHLGGPVLCNPKGKTKPIGIVKEISDDYYPMFNYRFIDILMQLGLQKPIWITSEFGDGQIVTFGDHPEYFSCKYPRVIYNSIFFLTSDGPFEINVNKHISTSDNNLRIIAPETGETGEAVEFDTNVKNINNYSFYWDFGDDTSSELPSPIHVYKKPGKNDVILIIIDNNSVIYFDNITIEIIGDPTAPNNPPHKPIIQPQSLLIVRPSIPIFYTVSTEEPDGDFFYYRIQYELSRNIFQFNYTLLLVSGQNIIMGFKPGNLGNYKIRYKAIDINGAESKWSDPLEISITRTPIITRIQNRLGFN